MAKLSKAMHRHLSAVCIQPGRAAYPGLSLATLQALEVRDLIRRVAERGHIFSPQNCIRWFPTDKGKEADWLARPLSFADEGGPNV